MFGFFERLVDPFPKQLALTPLLESINFVGITLAEWSHGSLLWPV